MNREREESRLRRDVIEMMERIGRPIHASELRRLLRKPYLAPILHALRTLASDGEVRDAPNENGHPCGCWELIPRG